MSTGGCLLLSSATFAGGVPGSLGSPQPPDGADARHRANRQRRPALHGKDRGARISAKRWAAIPLAHESETDQGEHVYNAEQEAQDTGGQAVAAGEREEAAVMVSQARPGGDACAGSSKGSCAGAHALAHVHRLRGGCEQAVAACGAGMAGLGVSGGRAMCRGTDAMWSKGAGLAPGIRWLVSSTRMVMANASCTANTGKDWLLRAHGQLPKGAQMAGTQSRCRRVHNGGCRLLPVGPP